MLQTNEVHRVEISSYTSEGNGVARIDGQAVFVKDAIAGEIVDIKISHVGKRCAFGDIIHIEKISPHRVQRKCEIGKRCGGCAFWHMDYEEEKRLKAERVQDAFEHIAKIPLEKVEIIGAPSCERYRNKVQYQVSKDKKEPIAGFYKKGTHDILSVDNCLIQSTVANEIKDIVLQWMKQNRVMPYQEKTHTGVVRHIYVRTAEATGQVLACIVANSKQLPQEADLVERLCAGIENLHTIVLSINTKKGNVVLGDVFRNLYGDGVLEEELCGLRFNLSARSFFQVNPKQAETLYTEAIAMADLTKEDIALDLYCGTGTITLIMAKEAKKVIGVELIEAAILDAKENAIKNQIENVEFFCSDAGDAAKKLAQEGIAPTVVVVDPPRKGLSPDVITAIGQMSPKKVVYVSCDPATLARDVKLLGELGYAPTKIKAIDMFPRCAHVETVILMTKA